MAEPAGSIAFRTVYTEQPAVLPDFQCPFKNTSVRVQIKIILPRPFAVDCQMAGNTVVPRIFPPDEIKFVPSFLKKCCAFGRTQFNFSCAFSASHTPLSK